MYNNSIWHKKSKNQFGGCGRGSVLKEDMLNSISFEYCPASRTWLMFTQLIQTDKLEKWCASFWYCLFIRCLNSDLHTFKVNQQLLSKPGSNGLHAGTFFCPRRQGIWFQIEAPQNNESNYLLYKILIVGIKSLRIWK